MLLSIALLLAPAYSLVANPGLRVMTPNPGLRSSAASPQMLLGGAGRSVARVVRRCAPAIPKLPGSGKFTGGGAGGISGGSGGAGGGDAYMSADGGDDEPKQDNLLANAWKSYNDFLEESPLLAKALTSFVGFLLGDILAQTFIQKSDKFDFYRLFRLASFGFFIHGTSSHYFYGWLDGKIPGTSAKVVFSKVAIDQVLWNPIFGVMFFTYQAGFELKGLGYVMDKVKNELLTQVTGSWKVWPIAHTINFRYIPSSQRVLYINTIQIGYNCFLSLISNRD